MSSKEREKEERGLLGAFLLGVRTAAAAGGETEEKEDLVAEFLRNLTAEDKSFFMKGGGWRSFLSPFLNLTADVTSTFPCQNSSGASEEEVDLADSFALWTEVVLQSKYKAVPFEVLSGSFASTFGVLTNSIAIYFLLTGHHRLNSVFHSMFVSLLALHALYVITTMVLVMRLLFPNNFALDFLFTHFLYLLKPALLHASTYVTVLMARERNTAVKFPATYKTRTARMTPCRVCFTYLFPSLIISLCFVSPLYFESRIERVYKTVPRSHDNGTMAMVNVASYSLAVTNYYVLWYKNLATLVFTILIPFILLLFWNWSTYSVIKQRRMRNRNRTSKSMAAAAQEETKARILFAITFLFISCNFPRFILNISECFSVYAYQTALLHGCNSIPLWALLTNSVSHLLLTLNAVLGIVVYCSMSSDFHLRGRCCRTLPSETEV